MRATRLAPADSCGLAGTRRRARGGINDAGGMAARGPEAADQADAAAEPGPRERDVGSLLRLVREQQEAYCALYERNAQLHREWSEAQLEVARLRAACAAARCLRGGRSGQ